jgi:hypothetical protein
MCNNEVIAEGYEFLDLFQAWLLKNSGALLVESPDLKKHGVCAITWTYLLINIHINAWENLSNAAIIGFKFGMKGIGNASLEMLWFR